MNIAKRSFLFLVSVCFLSCVSENDISDKETKQAATIVLTISFDEQISIANQIVGYCELEKRLEPLLENSKEVELRPSPEIKMHFVKCVVWKLGNLNVDSVRLRLDDRVVTVPTDKGGMKNESEKLHVVVVDEEYALLNEAKKPITELQELILAKLLKGVSYTVYLDCKEDTEKTISMVKSKSLNSTSFSARIVEAACELCF